MSNNNNYISSTSVASSVPFDNTTGDGYVGSDVQSVLQELRDYTIYDSDTNATTANGTLTLSVPLAGGDTTGVSSTTLQILTGTATGYSVQLPSALNLISTAHYIIANTTTQPVNILDGAGTLLFSLSQQSFGYLYLQAGGSAGGTWLYWQVLATSNATGIVSYNVVSSTTFATTSTTDVVITGFTVTPQKGTYAVWVNGSWTPQAGPGNLETCTIYNNGAAVADSLRSQSPIQSLSPSLMATQTITQVNDSVAIDVRIRSSSGQTLTVNQRSLLLIRLGN